ncbi:hypothetical protein INR49_026378 [Caranx melampygus]|nr:hypothetical protein INR49_026378 [Caranx melampygus]
MQPSASPEVPLSGPTTLNIHSLVVSQTLTQTHIQLKTSEAGRTATPHAWAQQRSDSIRSDKHGCGSSSTIPLTPAPLLQRANQMRLTGTLCDVIITVDGQEFTAHRTTFQQILEYAYTASLQATAEDPGRLAVCCRDPGDRVPGEQCLKVLETIRQKERGGGSEESQLWRTVTTAGQALEAHVDVQKHSIQDGPNRTTNPPLYTT